MCFPGPLKRLGLTPKKDSISHLKRDSGGGVHSSLKCRDSELLAPVCIWNGVGGL